MTSATTPPCQVYGGVDAERPTTNQAVESTAGEVLYYNGAVLEAVYTGNCGGTRLRLKPVMAGTRASGAASGCARYRPRGQALLQSCP